MSLLGGDRVTGSRGHVATLHSILRKVLDEYNLLLIKLSLDMTVVLARIYEYGSKIQRVGRRVVNSKMVEQLR